MGGRLGRYLRQARRLGSRGVLDVALGRLRAAPRRAMDLRRRTYLADETESVVVRPLLDPAAPLPRVADPAAARSVAEAHLAHRFDVLGSGWMEVRHGVPCRGFDGHRYPPGPEVDADRGGEWLRGRVTAANLPEARRLWAMVDAGYVPVDWHLDLRSGHRFPQAAWYGDVRVGHAPGADVKVPWELARLQHLPALALAAAQAVREGDEGFAERCRREHRNLVLDFAAANPPRFGVHWRTAMEVAIRGANVALADALFRAGGARYDAEFDRVVRRVVREHAAYVAAHLEWHPTARGNHYLANLAGLLLCAAWLAEDATTDAWIVFALRELDRETERQFHVEGSNFEASTGYHRLSAEMVAYAAAVAVGMDPARVARLGRAPQPRLPSGPRPLRSPSPLRLPGDGWGGARLARMADFLADLTAPDGRMVLVGDFDSGRFLRPEPVWRRTTVDEAVRRHASLDGYEGDGETYWEDDELDPRPLLGAMGALLDRADLAAGAAPLDADAALVRALSRGRCVSMTAVGDGEAVLDGWDRVPAGPPTHRIEFVAPAGIDLTAAARAVAYPAFGVYVIRAPSLYLAVRCGAVGQGGRGGHAHNDALAVELCIAGEPWVADGGTYVYTAAPALRDRHRSARAHFAPRARGREPGSLALGLFRLGDEARAEALAFGPRGFVGRHGGYGGDTVRRVTVEPGRVVVEDWLPAGVEPDDPGLPDVPFSPGYGRLLRGPLRVPLRAEARGGGLLVVTRDDESHR